MNSKLMRIASGLFITGALALAPLAQAAEGGGTVTYVQTWSEVTKLPGGRSLQRAYLKGVILMDKADGLFHLQTQDCSGSTAIGADGKVDDSAGSCTAVDKDGDVWWLSYHNGPQGNTWTIIGGTGKYKGMKGGGTSVDLVLTADGRLVNSWKGSWTMMK
jgi:hypothetical protein